MANSVDPDETPRSAASHLGLYCLLRPVCPNTYSKYGKCPKNLSFYGVVQKQSSDLGLNGLHMPFCQKF